MDGWMVRMVGLSMMDIPRQLRLVGVRMQKLFTSFPSHLSPARL